MGRKFKLEFFIDSQQELPDKMKEKGEKLHQILLKYTECLNIYDSLEIKDDDTGAIRTGSMVGRYVEILDQKNKFEKEAGCKVGFSFLEDRKKEV